MDNRELQTQKMLIKLLGKWYGQEQKSVGLGGLLEIKHMHSSNDVYYTIEVHHK